MISEHSIEQFHFSMETSNIFDYLTLLPRDILDELYNDPWTCQAVFRWIRTVAVIKSINFARSLPPMAKQIVMRMIFFDPTQVNIIVQKFQQIKLIVTPLSNNLDQKRRPEPFQSIIIKIDIFASRPGIDKTRKISCS